MKKPIKKGGALFLLCFLCFNCSFKAPSIAEISVKRLQIETETLAMAERLSIFLIYLDEDGKDDYSTVTVIHKESGLLWFLNRFNSSFFTSEYRDSQKTETRLWIGSNKLAGPQGRIPLGDYSVIAEDLAGNQTIKNVSIIAEVKPRTLPFSFSIQEDTWRIQAEKPSRYTIYSLILLGADRQPIFVKKLGPAEDGLLEDGLDELKSQYPDARYIQCMAENDEGSAAFLTKFYSLY